MSDTFACFVHLVELDRRLRNLPRHQSGIGWSEIDDLRALLAEARGAIQDAAYSKMAEQLASKGPA